MKFIVSFETFFCCNLVIFRISTTTDLRSEDRRSVVERVVLREIFVNFRDSVCLHPWIKVPFPCSEKQCGRPI